MGGGEGGLISVSAFVEKKKYIINSHCIPKMSKYRRLKPYEKITEIFRMP